MLCTAVYGFTPQNDAGRSRLSFTKLTTKDNEFQIATTTHAQKKGVGLIGVWVCMVVR